MSFENHQNVNADVDDCESDDEPLLRVPAEVDSEPSGLVALPEVATFLYFLALVIQYPVVQFWLFDHFANEYNLVQGNETDVCANTTEPNSSYSSLELKVQSESNEYFMYTNFVNNFVAIFPTLLLGPLTDKYGRKFVWYVCFVGLFIGQLLTLLVFLFDLRPDLLFVGSAVMGLSGSFGLFLSGAFGMIADITSPGKQRGFRVATLEATIAIASSLGVTLSGVLVKEIGYVWPTAVSMVLVALATLFVLIFIPETLVDRHYQPFSCCTLIRSFEFYVKDTSNKRRFKLIVCLVCFLISLGALIGESNFSLLFLLHQPFCWHKVAISIFSGIVTLLKWICVMLFIALFKHRLSDTVFAVIGCLSATSVYLLRGLAWSDLFIYIGAGTSLLMDLVQPMCRTIMSKSVSAAEQGALFAGIGVLQMITSASSGIIMSTIYEAGLKVYLGLPYLVLSGLAFISCILLIVLIFHSRWHRKENKPEEREDQVTA